MRETVHPKRPQPPKAKPYVLAFIEAVCPEAPALYAASFTEKTCLTDATDLIVSLRSDLTAAKGQLKEMNSIWNSNQEQLDAAYATIAAQSAQISKLWKAINTEPELPDEMPDGMWEAIKNDRGAMTELLRIAIRETKAGILTRAAEVPPSSLCPDHQPQPEA